MEYTVYKITYNNQLLYIGFTGNLDRRIKDHNSLFKNGHKKQLYFYLREQKFTGLIELIPIKTFKKKVDAKRYEAYLILKDYFSITNKEILKQTLLQKIPSIGR